MTGAYAPLWNSLFALGGLFFHEANVSGLMATYPFEVL